jgi:uncharacterized protein (TIGR02246 family)
MTSPPADLEGLVRRLVESWNERDADGFAALFTPSARYVTGDGQRVCGRGEIAGLVRGAEPGLHVVLGEPPSVECDAATGTVRFAWTAAPRHGAARQGRVACVVSRRDGQWLIESLENDEGRPEGEDR